MPLKIQRLHWIFLLFAVVIIGLWWSSMMIALLVVFAYGYRPTAEWRWQFTLFNSTHDMHVLIIGICIVGSFFVTGLITLIIWLIFRLKTIATWLSKFFGSLSFNPDVDLRSISSSTSFYYLSLYVTFLFNVNVILFHLSQSYHCVWLPFIRPVTIITQTGWSARFQSLTVSFMMLPAMLSLMVIDAFIRHYLFHRAFVLHRHKDEKYTMNVLLNLASTRIR
jgi:hypothetical protein